MMSVNVTFSECVNASVSNLSLLMDLQSDLRLLTLGLYTVTFTGGLLGNLLVICTLQHFTLLAKRLALLARNDAVTSVGVTSPGVRLRPSVADTFILNLAVADLFYVIFLPLFIWSTYANRWPVEGALSNVTCKLAYVGRDVSKFASIFTLLSLSVLQALACNSTTPNFCEQRKCRRAGRVVCAGIWLLCAAISTHYFRYVETVEMGGRPSCLINWPLGDRRYLQFWVLFQFLAGLALPSLAIFTIYAMLYRKVTSRPNLVNFVRPITKTVLSVALVFTLCNLPYHGLQLWKLGAPRPGCASPQRLLHYLVGNATASLLLFVPSCCNPLIYGLLNDRYSEYTAHCIAHPQ